MGPARSGGATIKGQQDQTAHGKYALQIHYPEMAAPSYAFIVAPHLPEAVKSSGPRAAIRTKAWLGGFEELGVGTRVWGAAIATAFDVYYDDIAIDTKRIGPVK